MITYSAANSRERIILFYKSKSLFIFTLCSLFEVALNSYMGRTSCLTWSSTGIIAVDSVIISVILIPFIFAPLCIIGQFVTRIYNGTGFCAKLLSELNRACRAIFNTFTTSNAILFLYLCGISRTRHIRCVEKLRCPQGVANIDITVTNSKNFIIAVDICNLMNKAVILCIFENLHSLIICNIVTLADFALIFFEPIRKVFYIDGLIFH